MPMTAQSGKPVVGIILAGGRGSRLAPLAAEFEKPVFPVDDLPLISHADRFAREFGVAKLIVVVSPVNASRIERNVDDALFVRQEVPTGFINALRLGTTIAQCHMWSDTSVLVLCSDNVFRPDGAWFRAAVAASGSGSCVGTLLTPDPNGRLTGVRHGYLVPRNPDTVIAERWVGPLLFPRLDRLIDAMKEPGTVEDTLNRAGKFTAIRMECRDCGIADNVKGDI
jgi:hypothetical protein